MLVIVDEASLASTAHLDALLRHATTAGAKLLLVGDHHQLGAVEAGGAFALLVETAIEAGTAHTLDTLASIHQPVGSAGHPCSARR